jgi:hypothetical protein
MEYWNWLIHLRTMEITNYADTKEGHGHGVLKQ